MKELFFFDQASTTQCIQEAAEVLLRFTTDHYGNPSSSHLMGKEAKGVIETSRKDLATLFGVQPQQIIFTGSGSEADNLAIYGVALDRLANNKKGRIISSPMEHAAVKKTVESLADLGFDIAWTKMTREGQVDLEHFQTLVTPDTVLVSIQLVNNIVGSAHNLERLAKITRTIAPQAVFHSDAVQGFCRVMHPLPGSGVDLLSISGHKVGGPKGVGALVVLNPTLLKSGMRPLIWGGEQEHGFRSGTQNAGLIGAFGIAAKKAFESLNLSRAKGNKLRSILAESLKPCALVRWNTPPILDKDLSEKFVPHIVSLSLEGIPGIMLACELESRGFIVSTGSACSSSKQAPDQALQAIGASPYVCSNSIRISFSSHQAEEEVRALGNAICEIAKELSA